MTLPSNPSRTLRKRRQAALLRRAITGDERAFRRLYRDLHPPISRYLGARMASPEDAEDLASKIFHRFLLHLPDYDPRRGSVRAWLFGMARNALIDHYRTRPEAKASLETLDSLAAHAGDPRPDALEAMILDEEARFVDGVLRGQPAETRELFALRYGQGLSLREISAVTGIAEPALRQRFSRVMRRLREGPSRETDTDKKGEVNYALD